MALGMAVTQKIMVDSHYDIEQLDTGPLEFYQELCRQLQSRLDEAMEARREGSRHALSWRSKYYQLRDGYRGLGCKLDEVTHELSEATEGRRSQEKALALKELELSQALERVAEMERALQDQKSELVALKAQNRELNRTADKLGLLCNQLKNDVCRISNDKEFYRQKVSELMDRFS